MSKTVYIAMAADLIHYGHINIILEGIKYGKIMIGLLTDEAIISYKRTPIIKYEYRKKMLENIKNIENIVEQNTLDYIPNLLKYKPKYVVHGDDWKEGPQKQTRQKVIETLKLWDGKLIEIPYTKNISTTDIIKKIKKN